MSKDARQTAMRGTIVMAAMLAGGVLSGCAARHPVVAPIPVVATQPPAPSVAPTPSAAGAHAARIVRAPGRARSATPERRKAVTPAQREKSAPPPGPTPDRAGAERLRREGLEQLVAGVQDRAVALLDRAAGLDPGNAAIARDLARARRVQATVRARH